MMKSSQGDLDAAENYSRYPNASDSYENAEEPPLFAIVMIFLFFICLVVFCIGVVGNGCIIWLLGFKIKRNIFTTFILNLAIADFGYIISIFLLILSFIFTSEFTPEGSNIFRHLCLGFMQVTYINANFLMTAISIDRCVAVLFPIWHRCSRPKHLSPAVCASLWICSFLLVGMMLIMQLTKIIEHDIWYALPFLVSAVVCLPLITLSTGVLFFKVCLKSNQRNQGRVLLTILITFLCFLILAFPQSVLAVINIFDDIAEDDDELYWFISSFLLSCLNSSINPVIYFLVGRKKGAQSEKSMKVILQNAFKEGEAT